MNKMKVYAVISKDSLGRFSVGSDETDPMELVRSLLLVASEILAARKPEEESRIVGVR